MDPKVYKGVKYEVSKQVLDWAGSNGINVFREIEAGIDVAIDSMNKQSGQEVSDD